MKKWSICIALWCSEILFIWESYYYQLCFRHDRLDSPKKFKTVAFQVFVVNLTIFCFRVKQFIEFYQRSCRKLTIIRNNMNYFIEQLQVKGLPNALHSAGCLADVERRVANSRKGSSYQIVELLEALKRKSTTQYLEFADCLRKSNQRILPRILEFGGGLVLLSGYWIL